MLTDSQPPGLLFQAGLLWRHLEGAVKERQVWAGHHVGGAETVVGGFRWLCCLQLSKEIKDIPRK